MERESLHARIQTIMRFRILHAKKGSCVLTVIRDLCFLAKKHKVNNKLIISQHKNLKSKSVLMITNFVDFIQKQLLRECIAVVTGYLKTQSL